VHRSIPLGLVASALALSGCSQLGIGASEPDEATQLMMEACGIEAVEGDGEEGPASGYEYGGFGGTDGETTDPVEIELDALQDMEDRSYERAVSSRAAARLDEQWDELATAFAENSRLNSRVLTYRQKDDTPTRDELVRDIPDWSDEAGVYNANLDFIDIECGALLRTLESAQ